MTAISHTNFESKIELRSIEIASGKENLIIKRNAPANAHYMHGCGTYGRAAYFTSASNREEQVLLLLVSAIKQCSEISIHPALEDEINRRIAISPHDASVREKMKRLRVACASIVGAQFIKQNAAFCRKFYAFLLAKSRIPLRIDSPMLVREDLLERILLQTSLLGNYTILSGVDAKVRADIPADEWTRVCYQRDERYGSAVEREPDYYAYEYIIDDPDENIDVFRGIGRRIYKKNIETEKETYKKLFLLMPNCFTFTYFRLGTEESIFKTANFDDRYNGLPIEPIIVRLPRATLNSRLNLLLPAGIYRLERTIFLTFASGIRTVAIRSAFCEQNGLPRYCDYFYRSITLRVCAHGVASLLTSAPSSTAISRQQSAGNASIFIALTNSVSSPQKLLGYWIGGYGYDACMFVPDLPIFFNEAVSDLGNAELKRVADVSYTYKVVTCEADKEIFEIAGEETFDAVRLTLTCKDWPSNPAKMSTHQLKQIERYCLSDEVRNSIHVDFLCAATEKNSHVRGVAFFLMSYALVHHWHTRVKSLLLFARRWVSRQAKGAASSAAGRNDHRFTSATVAYFYHRQFGLELVPRQFRAAVAKKLDSVERVQAAVLAETGMIYILDRWFDVLVRCNCKYTPDEMVAVIPELSNFYSAMLDARSPHAGCVDFERMINLPMFAKAAFYWQADGDESSFDKLKKTDVREVGSGLMFRYCPTIEELGERLDIQFEDLHARQRWQKSSTDAMSASAIGVSASDAILRRSIAFSDSEILTDTSAAVPPEDNDDTPTARTAWRQFLMQRNPKFMTGVSEHLEYHPNGTTTHDIYALFDIRQQNAMIRTPHLLQRPAWLDEQNPALYLKRSAPSPAPVDGQMHFIRRNGTEPIRLYAPVCAQEPGKRKTPIAQQSVSGSSSSSSKRRRKAQSKTPERLILETHMQSAPPRIENRKRGRDADDDTEDDYDASGDDAYDSADN